MQMTVLLKAFQFLLLLHNFIYWKLLRQDIVNHYSVELLSLWLCIDLSLQRVHLNCRIGQVPMIWRREQDTFVTSFHFNIMFSFKMTTIRLHCFRR